MDLKHIDLFSGVGGFALAAAWTGFETVVMCEKDEECREFLQRKWRLPVIGDIREFDGAKWPGATLITAGVPCQPVSHAGKRQGQDDDRWLWPETLRVISESKPTWCLLENPVGLGSMGEPGIPFDVVSRSIRRGDQEDTYHGIYTRQEHMQLDAICSELEGIGYNVTILDIPACALNSPQIRHRFWILANSKRTGHRQGTGTTPTGRRSDKFEWNDNQHLDDRSIERDRELSIRQSRQEQATCDLKGSMQGGVADAWSEYEWIKCADGKIRRAKSGVCGLAYGVPKGLLRGLGNAIVPQNAAVIMEAIREIEERGL